MLFSREGLKPIVASSSNISTSRPRQKLVRRKGKERRKEKKTNASCSERRGLNKHDIDSLYKQLAQVDLGTNGKETRKRDGLKHIVDSL